MAQKHMVMIDTDAATKPTKKEVKGGGGDGDGDHTCRGRCQFAMPLPCVALSPMAMEEGTDIYRDEVPKRLVPQEEERAVAYFVYCTSCTIWQELSSN